MKWAMLVGDPTILGWTTFGLYMMAAGCCFRKAHREKALNGGMPRAWRMLAIGLLLLGLNKQLDLQTTLKTVGRQLAIAEHLYQYRRELQLLFLAALVVIVVGIAVIQFPAMIQFARGYPICAAGGVGIALYALLRAGSFEHVDRLLRFDPGKVRGLWMLEVVGLCLVLGGTLRSSDEER